MDYLNLNSGVESLSGVGATRKRQLNKMGIYCIKDLIYNFPRMYEERGNVIPLAFSDLNLPSAFLLTVSSEVKSAQIRKGMTISKFKAFDDSGTVEIVFFNATYIKDTFHVGDRFRFWGKLSLLKNKLQLTNPKFEIASDDSVLLDFVPVYSLTQGIGTKFIEKITKIALDATVNQIVDPLPEYIRLKFGFPTISYALRNIHFPSDTEALKKSLDRLAFDEMLLFGIGVSKAAALKNQGEGIKFNPCDIKPLLSLLPYELTESQKRTVNEIYSNTVLGNEHGNVSPMARIVVGDVGSGKTVCATIAMYISAKSEYQSALMAPTEILARQHYEELSALYSKLGIKTELLLGSTSQKEKKRIYSAIENGECDVIIGTHAIISEKVVFKNLGLVVTDEQHRFGVNQRALLKNKSKKAHMLVMSATPIPRTLALVMYGDLDVSRITELPKGRMRVDTFVVDESYRSRLNEFIFKQIAVGGQCYIICPSIDRSEDEINGIPTDVLLDSHSTEKKQLNLKNVVEYTKNIRQIFPDVAIEALHGRMKAEEKDQIMSDFSSGKIKILISTTVIEVGINVPNASLIVIENAERFGLSQLHQLRGRVGRGTRKSYCVLVEGIKSEKSNERLTVLKDTYNGFEIAEKDLALRGPGDFFSNNANDNIRQSGGFTFKIASLCNDTQLFANAFSSAKELVMEDPNLALDKHSALKKAFLEHFETNLSTIS